MRRREGFFKVLGAGFLNGRINKQMRQNRERSESVAKSGLESEDRKDKRELILEAAVKVFSRYGYHKAKMEDIALEAGIGKGTIYEYFDSKLSLFQQMLERSRDIYYNSLIDGRQESLSFKERLRAVFLSHINFCRENRELTRVVFWDTEIMDEELKAWCYEKRKEKEEELKAVVLKAVENGEIRPVSPQVLGLVISGILASIWAPLTLENWDIEAEELTDALIDIIFNGIG